MSDGQTSPLPDYERPPVIEVVCGIQFKTMTDLTAPGFGVFWQRIRSEYPNVEEQPPLGEFTERFDKDALRAESQFEFLAIPPMPRIFFIDGSGNWVMQLQKERFLHNWRRVKDDDSYPRFAAVSERFHSAWQAFLAFCREEQLSEPQINQLELTYINHIPQGEGWDSLTDVGEVLPDLAWRPKHDFLPSPESIAWQGNFLLPERRGRLHVSVRHAVRRADERPVLLCELTARGMPPLAEPEQIQAWFALGREWIVRGFADLTGPTVQKEIWGRLA